MPSRRLFPDAQVTIGPVIEDGFYYDFAYRRGFTEEDLQRIEARMHEIARRDYPVARSVMPREEAVEFFRRQGEEYKARIIEAIPAGETISLYRQGEFVDLCRGPHVPSTGKLKAFKLTKVAGAYWRGDSRNEMLQRITARPGPARSSSRRTCTGSKRPKSGIIGSSGASWTCSTRRRRRRGWCSGTSVAGGSTSRSSST